MRTRKITLAGFLLSFILAACSNESIPETLTRQDFGTADFDTANDVATPKGGVGAVVVGQTNGALNGSNLGGPSDAFIRRYDNGVGWAGQFGTRRYDSATKVAVTSTGISYVVGTTQGALRFKVGSTDVFLRKYDASGVLQWTRQFGTTGIDNASDVTLDSSGNIYVLSKDSNTSFTVRKFNTSGKLSLNITNYNPKVIDAPALAVDSTGDIFVLTRYVESPNVYAKIYRFNSAGGYIMDVIFSGYQIIPYDLVIDTNNNLTYSGYNDEANSNGGGFVNRVNNALTQSLWSKSIEPATTGRVSRPRALTLDSKNNVYVTGVTHGAYSGFTNAGDEDIFVLKLASATGNRIWTRQFGGNDSDVGSGIAVSDAVYVAGYSISNPNLLGDPGYGSFDAFLAQLSPGTGAILGIDQ